jgi:hypothetical protein
MTKRQKFIKLVSKGLEELGAEKLEETYYPSVRYKLQTRVGRLDITMPVDEDSRVLTVFSRFDEPDRAKEITDCNIYSGKWNFHYHWRGTDVKEASKQVLASMRRVAA